MRIEKQTIYERYLLSQEWSLRCCRKLARDGGLTKHEALSLINRWPNCRGFRFKCENCGQFFPRIFINIHHKTYERLYHEKNEDLAILCEGCHANTHGKDVPCWWNALIEGRINIDDLDSDVKPMAVVVGEFSIAERMGRLIEPAMKSAEASA
jgi:hypothetical protein